MARRPRKRRLKRTRKKAKLLWLNFQTEMELTFRIHLPTCGTIAELPFRMAMVMSPRVVRFQLRKRLSKSRTVLEEPEAAGAESPVIPEIERHSKTTAPAVDIAPKSANGLVVGKSVCWRRRRP